MSAESSKVMSFGRFRDNKGLCGFITHVGELTVRNIENVHVLETNGTQVFWNNVLLNRLFKEVRPPIPAYIGTYRDDLKDVIVTYAYTNEHIPQYVKGLLLGSGLFLQYNDVVMSFYCDRSNYLKDYFLNCVVRIDKDNKKFENIYRHHSAEDVFNEKEFPTTYNTLKEVFIEDNA